MGTWGSGNFDGDAPSDVRDTFVRETAERIQRELFAAETDIYAADGQIMPWIAMLQAICDQCGGHPPRPHAIARWQARYLELFEIAAKGDAGADGEEDDFTRRRRVVI